MFFNQFQGNRKINNDEYYNILGVDKNADTKTIKKAYHKLAVKCHPDKGGDPDKFKSIAEAFEVLSDPEKKQLYDSGGKEALEGSGMSNPTDIFSQMFNPGSNNGRQRVKKGNDINYPMNLTLNEIYNGCNKNISLARSLIDKNSIVNCPGCNGQGMRIQKIQMGPMIQQIQSQCHDCTGRGKTYKTKKEKENIKIYVPKGASNNYKIVIDDKGEDILNGEPGNLIVKINIIDHETFKRKGNDLFIDYNISLIESLCGIKVVIEHLDDRKIYIKTNGMITPTLFNPLKDVSDVKWKIYQGKECKMEAYANAKINDINQIKKIIEEGQLKEENINGFIIKDKTTYFFKQSEKEILEKIDNSKYDLYIKENTNQDKNMYCIEDEGLPHLDNPILKGDLFINFVIVYPEKINDKGLLKDLLMKSNVKESLHDINLTKEELEELEEYEIKEKNPYESFESYEESINEEDSDNEGDNNNQQQCQQQ